MTRKSQQPGGHNPLTYAERKRLKTSGYGTQSTRLTTDSQLPFGYCCLSVSPINTHHGDQAVATPSGHLYSREAIVQYLLTKNLDLKRQRAEYDKLRMDVENRRVDWEKRKEHKALDKFVKKNQTVTSDSTALIVRDGSKNDTIVNLGSENKHASTRNANVKENSLEQVSYWLATSQPTHQKRKMMDEKDDFDYEKELQALPMPPPERPASPMSGEPLKLKQLIPLHLIYEEYQEKIKGIKRDASSKPANTGKVLCSVSHKAITTQSAVCIKPSGQVMLKSVYEELAKPTMTCPITGKKFQAGDVLELIKGKSGFAASGDVIAKKYNPTLT